MDNTINKNNLQVGDYVKHFKRETLNETELKENPNMYTYRIIGFAKDSESLEDYVVYEAMYENPTSKIWIRKAVDFFSEVNHNVYPDIKQKYKFELI